MDITDQWRLLAIALGFEFRNEIRPRVELPSMHQLAAKALKKGKLGKAEQILESPMMKSMLSKAFLGSAAGFYRGFEFALFRGSVLTEIDSSPIDYVVNIVLMLPNDLGLGLDIKAVGLWDKIGGMILAGRYIRFPDNPAFDAAASVKALDKKAAGKLLASRRLVEDLAELYRFSNRFIIGDDAIRYDERGEIIPKDRALEIMDLMVKAAEGLSRTGG